MGYVHYFIIDSDKITLEDLENNIEIQVGIFEETTIEDRQLQGKCEEQVREKGIYPPWYYQNGRH